jgi:trigger factor
MGDYAVASYEASVDGKPLAETAPKAPAQLKSRRNAWILMSEGTLFPGFAKAIEGMEPEQQRNFELDVPESFPVPELRGKKVAYSLTLHGINTKVPPALDDELANRIEPGSTLDSLRKKIRERHEESAEAQFKSAVRKAVIEKLLEGFACELPEDLVHLETKSIVKDIVMESQARGLSDEDIKEQTGKIVETAEGGAKDRVRANFLLLRIAEKEGLDASEAELHEALLDMSREYNIPLKKLVKDIGRSGTIGRIREQIRISKALDLAVANATVAATAEPSTPNT